ncbi:MAG: DNA-3-methyladenine glycosylase family protein [Acidobacteriota bacterium]
MTRRALQHLRQSDPVLCRLIEHVGPYRIKYRQPDFQSLVRSIVFQQLSGKAATTIFNRLVDKVGREPLTAGEILKLNDAELRSLGLSRQKASYLQDLARRTDSMEIAFSDLGNLPDEGVIEHLTRVQGVGVWTAHMFLIFALRRPDVLPTGDLGIRAAIKRVYRLRSLPDAAKMEKLARKWRPYCSVACWYLWRSLDNE